MTSAISPQTDFLIVIDVQRDFCPGGSFAIPDADRIVPAINALAQKFNRIVLVQDWHPADHCSFASNHEGKAVFDMVELSYGPQMVYVDHCVQGTPGAEFHPDLRLDKAEALIRKGFDRAIESNSGFIGNDGVLPTGLEGYLKSRGARRLFMTGLAFDGCVRRTAEHAKQLGFETVVVRDATYTFDNGGGRAAAAAERMVGLGIDIIDSHQLGAN